MPPAPVCTKRKGGYNPTLSPVRVGTPPEPPGFDGASELVFKGDVGEVAGRTGRSSAGVLVSALVGTGGLAEGLPVAPARKGYSRLPGLRTGSGAIPMHLVFCQSVAYSGAVTARLKGPLVSGWIVPVGEPGTRRPTTVSRQ